MGARTAAENTGHHALALLVLQPREKVANGNAICICDWASEANACLSSANDGSLCWRTCCVEDPLDVAASSLVEKDFEDDNSEDTTSSKKKSRDEEIEKL